MCGAHKLWLLTGPGWNLGHVPVAVWGMEGLREVTLTAVEDRTLLRRTGIMCTQLLVQRNPSLHSSLQQEAAYVLLQDTWDSITKSQSTNRGGKKYKPRL